MVSESAGLPADSLQSCADNELGVDEMTKKAQPQTQPQERVSNPQSARSWLATMVNGKRLAFSAMPSDAEKRAAMEAKVLGTEVQSVIAWTDYLGNV